MLPNKFDVDDELSKRFRDIQCLGCAFKKKIIGQKSKR